jgi:hypothetical protein
MSPLNNPAQWLVTDTDGNTVTLDLSGLLYWNAIDANGHQMAFQTLDAAVNYDANRTPTPALPRYLPWPFQSPGMPAGTSQFGPGPVWPTPAPPIPPAQVQIIGVVAPTAGEGTGLLFPPRKY